MSWRPNAEAAAFLATEVLPALKVHLPDVRLRIVGRDPLPKVRALSQHASVEVTGSVPDMIPHLRDAHVLAVPLEAGGGTRLKILEAFAAGLPVASTPVGCEGIKAEAEQHLTVASRAGFAEALVRLLLAPDRASAMADRARTMVRDHYEWRAIGAVAERAIRETHAPISSTAPVRAVFAYPCSERFRAV